MGVIKCVLYVLFVKCDTSTFGLENMRSFSQHTDHSQLRQVAGAASWIAAMARIVAGMMSTDAIDCQDACALSQSIDAHIHVGCDGLVIERPKYVQG